MVVVAAVAGIAALFAVLAGLARKRFLVVLVFALALAAHLQLYLPAVALVVP